MLPQRKKSLVRHFCTRLQLRIASILHQCRPSIYNSSGRIELRTMENRDGIHTSGVPMCDGDTHGRPLVEIDTGVLLQHYLLEDEEITLCSSASISSADDSSSTGSTWPGQISVKARSVETFQHVVCWMLLILTHFILYSMADAKHQNYTIHNTNESVRQQLRISLCELGSILPILFIILSMYHQSRYRLLPPALPLVFTRTICAVILWTEMIVNAILATTHTLSVASITLSSTIVGITLSTLFDDHYWLRASNRAWYSICLGEQRQSHSHPHPREQQYQSKDNVSDDFDNETIDLLEQSLNHESDPEDDSALVW